MRETGKGGNCQMTFNTPEKEGKESYGCYQKTKEKKKINPSKAYVISIKGT